MTSGKPCAKRRAFAATPGGPDQENGQISTETLTADRWSRFRRPAVHRRSGSRFGRWRAALWRLEPLFGPAGAATGRAAAENGAGQAADRYGATYRPLSVARDRTALRDLLLGIARERRCPHSPESARIDRPVDKRRASHLSRFRLLGPAFSPRATGSRSLLRQPRLAQALQQSRDIRRSLNH